MMKISKLELESITELHQKNEKINREIKKKFFQSKNYVITLNPNELDNSLVDVLNEVDNILFLRWKNPLKLPAYFGLILTIFGLIIQIFIFSLVFIYFLDFDPVIGFILVFVISFIQSTVLHVPAHYIVGWLLGIKTKNIFITSSSIGKAGFIFKLISKVMILPGLKYDLKSFLEASKRNRALFLSSGVWITYPILFFNLILTLLNHKTILPNYITILIVIFILGLTIFVFMTSWYYYGDFYKARAVYKKREKIEFI